MLNLLRIAVPSAENKCRYIKIIKQLTLIMQGGQPLRVDTRQPLRVDELASTLNNTTAPRVVRATNQIHQQKTRSNTPMPEVMEVEEPPCVEYEQEKQQQLISLPISLPSPLQQSKVRKMNDTCIGGKRNNLKVASQK